MTQSVWDSLLFRARINPYDLAVFGPRGPVTYQVLVGDVAGLATELIERGFGSDDMVGIGMRRTYLHLLLILALDRLNVPSASLDTVPASDMLGLVRKCGLSAVISGEPAPVGLPCRWIHMPEQDRPTIAAPDRARLGAIGRPLDQIVRVIWSSGTTGGAKGTAMTRVQQLLRVGLGRSLRGFAPTTRLFMAMRFQTIYGYNSLLGVLTAGGTVVLPNAIENLFALVTTIGVNKIGVNVLTLTELVGQSNSRRRMDTLQIDVMGSHLPGKLAQAARDSITPAITSIYGTTEAITVATGDASLCIADASAVGYLVPSIGAQIVDFDDMPLAAGEEGILRLRGGQIVYGYYRDETATSRNFRDGWFYPGDVGMIDTEGLLRITGRTEDVMRRGKRARSPLPIEAAIANQAGVREAAVFPLDAADGTQRICVALVLEPSTSADTVLAEARRRLGDDAPTVSLVIDAFPRNVNGKVIKRELARLVRQASDGGRLGDAADRA